jgi:flagellar hook-associated protein 3 FlgL
LRADPTYINSIARAIDQSSSAGDALTTQLSSGLRVSSLQDDPVAAAQSALLGSAISRDDSFVQTASGEAAMLQVADSALGEVVSQVTSALTLGVQGSNGTLNAANIGVIVQQLTAIRDQVLSLANTSYLGQSLFAGSQGSVKPFTLDTSTQPATVSYVGDTKLQYIETPTGQKIQVNLPGSDIFGTSSTGVLGALNQMISDLSSGAPSASVTGDVSTLTSALSNVSAQRGILNSSLSRVKSTSTYVQTDEAQLKAQQIALVSSDTVSVATQMKSQQVQRQALLSVMSALQKTNLFDYLH